MPETTKTTAPARVPGAQAVTDDFWRNALDIEKNLTAESADKPEEKPADKPTEKAPDKPDEAGPNKSQETPPAKVETKPPAKTETPPAKPAAEPTGEDEPPEEHVSPTGARQWKEWKARQTAKYDAIAKEYADYKTSMQSVTKEREALMKERDDLKKAIDAAKARVAPEEVESLKKELEEVKTNLRVVNLEADPKFRSYYDNEANTRIERAKRVVGMEKAARVEELLRMPDSEWKDQQLEELGADMSPIKQTRLAAIVEELAGVKANREAEVEKWRQKGVEMEQERAARAKQAEADEAKRLEVFIDDGLAKLAQDDTLKPVWDDDTAQLTKSLILNPKRDPKDTLGLIARGAAYPKALTVINQLLAAKTELESTIAKQKEEYDGQISSLQAATPTAGKTEAETAEPARPDVRKMSPQQALDAWVTEAQRMTRE